MLVIDFQSHLIFVCVLCLMIHLMGQVHFDLLPWMALNLDSVRYSMNPMRRSLSNQKYRGLSTWRPEVEVVAEGPSQSVVVTAPVDDLV